MALVKQVRVGRFVNGSFGGCVGASLFICVLLFITLRASNVGAELSVDGQALVNFLQHNRSRLDLSLGFSAWNASEDTPCGWERVFCTPESAVHRLDLSACIKVAPSEQVWMPRLNLTNLKGLDDIQELDLSSNPVLVLDNYMPFFAGLTWLDLSGSYYDVGNYDERFPIFPQLPSLQYLNAKATRWSWYVNQSFERLGDLVALSLANNTDIFKGGLPEKVGSLTKLKTLDLSGSSFNGSIPSLEGLTRLTKLSVSRNQFSGNVPAAPSLQYLEAAQNNLTNLVDFFFQMSALKQVNLSRNQLVGELPGSIDLKFLEVLDLSWNGLQGHIPSGLGNVSHLDLSHNNLSGPIPLDIPAPPFGSHNLSGTTNGWICLGMS